MSSASNRQGIGFITVRKHPEHGYFGGLLIVNALGRPLEFHCSLPFKPSKSQLILYGPTLDEFICGEQIARTLIGKAKAALEVLFTDVQAALAVRNVTTEPIACLDVDESEEAPTSLERPAVSDDRLASFKLADCRLVLLRDYRDDESRIKRLWEEHRPQFELHEPFGRIAEALVEAHPSAKAA